MPWMNLRIRSERVFSQVPTFKSRNNQSVAIDAATRAMRIVANRMIWRPENQREARYADVRSLPDLWPAPRSFCFGSYLVLERFPNRTSPEAHTFPAVARRLS